MSKKLVRLSASIEETQKMALEEYAQMNNLKNQFGAPGLNLALREILDTHPSLSYIIGEIREENRDANRNK